ncbi:MAG: response regulator [Ginsengibacter sp.]
MRQKLNCIMLIDDDEPTNFLNSMIIEEGNYADHIQIKDSGKKALAYLANSQSTGYCSKQYPWPDLIFLDINMPAMNGWEFLEKLKEQRNEQEEREVIIMLTTSLNPDDKNRADAIKNVVDFKHKTLTEEILNEILATYFMDQKTLAN